MDLNSVCRTCLSAESLNPIFPLPEYHESFSNAIFLITDVKITLNDGLPQNICLPCLKLVNDTIRFRSKCKETQETLLSFQKHPANNDQPHSVGKNDPPVSSGQVGIKNEDLKGLNDMKTEGSDVEDDTDDQPLKYLRSVHGGGAVKQSDDTGIDAGATTKIKLERNCDKTDHIASEIKTNVSKETSPDENIQSDAIGSLQPDSNKTMVDQNAKTSSLYNIDISNPSRKRVSCKLCQKNLSIRSIDLHLSRCHPEANGRKAKCKWCNNYVLREKMSQHRLKVHGTTFRCAYCKWEFGAEDRLIEHVPSCAARKRRACESARALTECDVCHKKMQKASLRLHTAVKHAGLRPVCEHCGVTCGNRLRLREHRRAKHGYAKHRCGRCGYQSASALALQNHERRHRGEKPFVCERCGAEFHAAYLLAQHRGSHRTDRRFECGACGAKFKTSNAQLAHARSAHAGARPRNKPL